MGTLRRSWFRRRHAEGAATPPEPVELLDDTGKPFALVAPPPLPPWRRLAAGLAIAVFAAGTIFVGYAGVHMILQPAKASRRAFDGVVVTPRILDLLHPTPPAVRHQPSPVRHATAGQRSDGGAARGRVTAG